MLAEPGVAAAVPLTRTEAAVAGGAAALPGGARRGPARPGAPARCRATARGMAGALGSPGWIAVTPELAADRGWKVGDAVRVSAGGRRATLRIGALVDFRRVSPLASRRLGVMDIAEAQSLLGPPGGSTRSTSSSRPGADAAEVTARLQARLGPAVRVTTPGAAGRRGLRAPRRLPDEPHRPLAHQPVRGRVPGLREHAGGHGATPRGDRRPALPGRDARAGARPPARGGPAARHRRHGAGDPARLARAPGSSCASVSATVQNLYLLEGIDRVTLTPALLALAVALGVAGSLAGALLPALDVSRRDPRALLASLTLEERDLAGGPAAPRRGAGRPPRSPPPPTPALGSGPSLGGLPGGAGNPGRASRWPRRRSSSGWGAPAGRAGSPSAGARARWPFTSSHRRWRWARWPWRWPCSPGSPSW